MTGTVKLSEETTINEVTELGKNIKDALTRWNELIVDAAGVNRIDISVVQLLLAAQKECSVNNKKMILRASDAVKELLSLTGIKIQ